MMDSSQRMLDFLLPLAAVVYIIVAVILFLLRNQERLECEIAQEEQDALLQNPAARTGVNSRQKSPRDGGGIPPETEGEPPNLHGATVAHPNDAAGARTDLRRVSNKDKGLPSARV
jgi:hypothetical protein